MVTVYYKSPVTLDRESVIVVHQEISELLSRLYNHEAFNQDLKYLKSRGITQKTLISILNISKRSFQYWKKGEVKPKNPYYFLMVRRMAKQLREKEKAQREVSIKPRVTASTP